MVPDIGFDSEGNVDVSLKSEDYTTEGNEFFYMLRTVNPASTNDKLIRVGEIDGNNDWEYNSGEQVNYVQKWKRLHYDNSTIFSGMKSELNPLIEDISRCSK
jgi:hypothetical protein